MNIFVLHLEPRVAAQMHVDKHVVKMVLETAQLLSTAHHRLGTRCDVERLYKETHPWHPCAAWVRERAANYRWTYALFANLCDEYTHRYGKVHATDHRLRLPLMKLPEKLRDNAHEQLYDVTDFALAMPDEYKDYRSVVRSYRAYYRGDKAHMASWTGREVPHWWEA